MQSNFAASFALVLKDEGGNVDDPKDRGGRTSRGVTQRTYGDFRKSFGKPAQDVYKMDDVECQAIYNTRYWNPTGCNPAPKGPDYAAFDYSVNSGVTRGKAALAATEHMLPMDAVKDICAKRTSFVNAIKDFAKFRKGVLARVARVEAAGAVMAVAALNTPAAIGILKANAADAKAKADSAATKAKVAVIPAVGSTAGAPTAAAVHADWWAWGVGGLVVVALVLVVAYFVYQHQKHSARADAYAVA